MKPKRSFCRYCGEKWLDIVLSNRGVCPECGKRRLSAAITQMQAKHGPLYDKWRRNYIASMQATINKLREEQQQDDIPF